MFSRRLPEDLRPNALSEALAEARRSARVEHDLTLSNPTLADLPYPADLLAPLASPEGLRYRPDPQGLAVTREALAAALAVPADRIVLAASTSEAYALVFKLLADPGDTVAFPAPSYPLIEHLARLEGLRPVAYRLDPEDDWRPDLADLPAALRALVAVSPNNPTGSYLDEAALATLAAAGVPLVVDEVFRAFPLDSVAGPSGADVTRTLTFTLGGLSKELGLPQLKLAWIVVSGPAGPASAAVLRLAFLADQYLSVATPVQLALPALLARATTVREAILARCRGNLQALRALARDVPEVSVLPAQGGWSAVLRIPAVDDEEALVLRLLRTRGVAVQPGYFYDFAREGYLVLSLLPPAASFREGSRRALEEVAALAR